MARFRLDGKEYELIDRPLFAEFAWVEDQCGISVEEMRGTRKTAATVLLSLRRAGVILTWADVMDMAIEDLEWVPDDSVEGSDGDPTSAGGEAGPGVSGSEPTSIGS